MQQICPVYAEGGAAARGPRERADLIPADARE